MSIMSCQVVLNAMVVPATARGRTTTLTADGAIDRPGLPGSLSNVWAFRRARRAGADELPQPCEGDGVHRHQRLPRAFYGDRPGFPISHEDDQAVVLDLNGTMLRISAVAEHVPQPQPQPHMVLGWEVADIKASVRDLGGRGIAFEVFEGHAQDALGIWTAPDGTAQVAWFRDPDGNLLSLTQF